MSATIIDGAALARESRSETADRVAKFRAAHGWAPGLATVLVGDDPASDVYVRRKRKAADAAGFVDFHRHLPGSASETEVAVVLEELAADPAVSGILLQLPLPQGLDRYALVDRIPVGK